MKHCCKCGRDLPASQFHADRRRRDIARGWNGEGLSSWCKTCRAAWVASRRDEVARYNAEHYQRHKDQRIQQIRAYQREHPEVGRVVCNRRRARKQAALGSHTAKDLRAIYGKQDGRCYYCGAGPMPRAAGHFDHVVPLVRGGSDSPDNIVFTCERCNRVKHTRTLEEFLTLKGRLSSISQAQETTLRSVQLDLWHSTDASQISKGGHVT